MTPGTKILSSRPSAGAGQRAPVAVHEALAGALVAQGVEVVFCLMGDGNKHLLVDLARLGVRLVHARHEGAALAMADGYARAQGAGGLGVCAVTYGPGVTQLSTSLMVATKHGTPLCVFAADVPEGMRDSGGHLDVDERAVLEAAGARVREVRDPARATDDVHLALFEARRARRPVALLVGVDLQDRLAPAPPADGIGCDRPARTPRPDPSSLDEAAAALGCARRPVVLAGRGAVLSGAQAEVVSLVERTGAVLATTFAAKGWPGPHPRAIGIAGGFALGATRAVLERADCVVALGASLNAHTTDEGRLFSGIPIVQVDTASHALVRNRVAADVYVQGDARTSVACLLEVLADTSATTWPELGPVALPDDPRHEELAHSPADLEPGRVDPRLLMLALDDALTDDALVVVGGGHFMAFAAQYLTNPGSRTFEMVFDFMTTGQAVPAAIGAAVASRERPVVGIEGDASFLMHVQELETAARAGVPVTIVVVNDGALGAEYHKLMQCGDDPSQALAEPPDLAALAVALGGAGTRVDDCAQMAGALAAARAHAGPFVIDCKVSRAVVGPL